MDVLGMKPTPLSKKTSGLFLGDEYPWRDGSERFWNFDIASKKWGTHFRVDFWDFVKLFLNDPSSDYKVDVFSPKMTTLSKKTSGFCSEDGYVRNIFLQFWKNQPYLVKSDIWPDSGIFED